MAVDNHRNSTKVRRLRALVATRGADCYRCTQPIDYTLKYPNPRSFSLEHKVPVSVRPDLAYDATNCAASHLECNQAASDKMDVTLEYTTSRRW